MGTKAHAQKWHRINASTHVRQALKRRPPELLFRDVSILSGSISINMPLHSDFPSF
jgi:hypothetical protein